MFPDSTVTRPSIARIASALLLSLLMIGSVVVAPAGAQGASATEIDACTTITDPGQYVLTADIRDSDAGTCIDVQADDVVIDGAGYTLDGQDAISDQTGVSAESQSNVVVRNLEVSEWGSGVNYTSVTGGEVSGVTALSNAVGIELSGTTGVTVDNNTVRNTDNGIFLHAVGETTADNNTVRNNEVTNTTLAITFIGADNNTVTNNTLQDSGLYGLSLLYSADGNDYNEFRDNVIVNSTEDAVCLLRARHNTFENTYVENSGRYDVYAVNGSTDNRVENLTLTSVTMSATLRDVSLVATDDQPATSPTGNASATGYVNATDTSPGTDAGTEVYLAVDTPSSNASSATTENGSLVYQYTGDEWVPIGEDTTEANATGTNVTDLGESGTHQVLAFAGEGFTSTASGAASTGGSGSSAMNASETTTDTDAGTGNGSGTGAGATTETTTGSDATGASNATDGAGTTGTGTATSGDGGGQATETSGPGFGLAIAVVALLAAALLAARRRE